MYSQVISGALYGLASEQVIVETDLSPEFNRYVLEMLRQPLEDERVIISRI